MTDGYALDPGTERRLRAVTLIKKSHEVLKSDPKKAAELRAEATELLRALEPAAA